jgi:cell division protein FtsI (penicillin-binding protein 3)
MTSLTVSSVITSGRVELVNVRQRLLLIAKVRLLWVLCLFALVALTAVFRIALL